MLILFSARVLAFNPEVCSNAIMDLEKAKPLTAMSISQASTITMYTTTAPTIIGQFSSSLGECSALSARESDKLEFLKENYHSLRIDSSRGEGEYLNSFISLYACDKDKLPKVKKMFQTNHQLFFQQEENPKLIKVYNAINTQMFMQFKGICNIIVYPKDEFST